MQWQGEVLKSIIFPVSLPRDAGELWREIAGEMPDNSQRRGLPPPLLSTASGIWKGFTLNVIAQQGRVEANLTAVDPSPAGPAPIPPIPTSKIVVAINLIREAAAKLLTGQPSVRFAAATQYVQRVESVGDGVKVLNAELKNIFPSVAESPLFQVNVRKPLTKPIAGEMNRLCKWGVASIGNVAITLDQRGNVVGGMSPDQVSHFAFAHYDINNKPFDRPLTDAEAATLTELLWKEEALLREGGFGAL